MIRSRRRAGDNAEMAIIQFVEGAVKEKKAPRKRRVSAAKKSSESTQTVEA